MDFNRVYAFQPSKEAVELSQHEAEAVALILSTLEQEGVDPASITTQRTKEYLTLVANDYFAFCNLKLSGRVWYVELSLSAKDIERLQDDERIKQLPNSTKKFSRFVIADVQEVAQYTDLAVLAYHKATNVRQ